MTSKDGQITNVNSICTNPPLASRGLDGVAQPGGSSAFGASQKRSHALVHDRVVPNYSEAAGIGGPVRPWSCPAERGRVHLCLLQTPSTYSSLSNPLSVTLPRGGGVGGLMVNKGPT